MDKAAAAINIHLAPTRVQTHESKGLVPLGHQSKCFLLPQWEKWEAEWNMVYFVVFATWLAMPGSKLKCYQY